MPDPTFDPRELPDAERHVELALDLCAALALLDDPDARAWRRCRAAALRFLEALRDGQHDARFARGALGRAAATWAAPDAAPAWRDALTRRIPFWVGTVYGLRWRTESPAPVDGAASAEIRRPPPPGRWSEMQAWRGGLAEGRRRLGERRAASAAEAAAGLASSTSLLARAFASVMRSERTCVESLRVRARAAHAWQAGSGPAAAVPAAAPAAGVPLSHAQIRVIARRIRRAVKAPPPDDPRDDISSPAHELSPADEARVEAELLALLEAEACARDAVRRRRAERAPTRSRRNGDGAA